MTTMAKATLLLVGISMISQSAIDLGKNANWHDLISKAPFGVLLVVLAWMFLNHLQKISERHEETIKTIHEDGQKLHKETNEVVKGNAQAAVALQGSLDNNTKTLEKVLEASLKK